MKSPISDGDGEMEMATTEKPPPFCLSLTKPHLVPLPLLRKIVWDDGARAWLPRPVLSRKEGFFMVDGYTRRDYREAHAFDPAPSDEISPAPSPTQENNLG